MKSKVERINDSIDNMQEAIRFYLDKVRDKYYSNDIPEKDYLKIEKDFMDLSLILTKLRSLEIKDNKKIEEIRRLHLSNLTLYEQGDYDYLFVAIGRVNHEFYKDVKDVDSRRVTEFKRVFKSLPTFYQDRLKKAEILSEDNIGFNNKKVDNYGFITEKYMQVKYGFKKIKYKVSSLSPMNLSLIEECNRIIKSNKKNNEVKEEFTTVRDIIAKYASYEIIIDNLKKILPLCDDLDYFVIKERTLKLIAKYQKLSKENKIKYNEAAKKVINYSNQPVESDLESLKRLRNSIVSQMEKENTEESGMKL